MPVRTRIPDEGARHRATAGEFAKQERQRKILEAKQQAQRKRHLDLSRKWQQEGVPPLEINKRLRKAGLIPGGVKGEPTGALRLGLLTIGQLGLAARQAPGGIYGLGKAITEDVKQSLPRTKGGPTLKHTTKVAKETGKGIVETTLHPGKYPGYFLLNLFTAGSLGAGALSRAGAAGSALRSGAGVRAAVTRSGAKGGSLLRRPQPGTAEIASGVGKLLPRNALLRPATKLRARGTAKTAREGREARALLPGRPGQKITDEMSAQSRVGRELRARRRIETDLANANANELRATLRGVKKPEHSAIGVVGVEGRAALENPAEVIGRQIRTHEQFIPQLRAELAGHRAARRRKQARDTKRAIEANQEHIRNLARAYEVLANPSPRFMRALDVTRRVANETEAESIRRGLLDAAEASGRKAKIAAIYGHKGGAAPEGSFYFPMSRAYTERFHHPATARGYTPALQEMGLPKPTPGRYWPGRGKQFTGRSVKLAGVGPRVAEHIGDVAARRNRLFSAQDFHEQLRTYATDAKTSPEQIPLRETAAVNEELRRVLAKAEERAVLEPGKAARLADEDARQIADTLKSDWLVANGREVQAGDVPVGTKIPGVQWVDRRYIKDLDAINPRTGLGRAIDEYVNRPARFGFIYARPAYVLNKLGNWTMLAVTEGHMFPQVMRDAKLAERRLAPGLVAKIDSGVGTTRTGSYLSRRSRVGKATHDIQNFWQRVTDQTERRAAFFGEARRAGFTDETGWQHLLTSDEPAVAAKRIEVFRRARRNIVDFDSMTPAEQQIAMFVFVYPWLTRGSMWAVHATLEHPAKAATLANLGRAEHKDLLGGLDLTSWLEDAIPIRIGGKTYLANPMSVNTYATAADVGQNIAGGVKGMIGLPSGQANFADIASPAVQIGLAGGGLETSRHGGLLGLAEGTSAGQLVVRGGIAGKPSKTYPHTGVYDALAPFFAGGLAPREPDWQYIAEQARKQRRKQNKGGVPSTPSGGGGIYGGSGTSSGAGIYSLP